ncbi:ACP S-malonyltransferase [Nocardia sp. NPDC051030]|uniref:ACP S-malonyltransferase n=1 Tax=Nocardia sp. NPDC051030 TaxID=3155162 RepID=UPI0034450A7E
MESHDTESTADARTGTAVLFPGMGPGDFATVAKFMLINPIARQLTKEASEVLGYDLVVRYRDAEGDYAEAAQVAFFVNCIALARWAQAELGMTPSVCAGVSFGGKGAAVFSGALDFADGVRLTADLVRYESEYFAREHTDVVTQSIARLPQEKLELLLAELAERGEWHEVSCHVDQDFHMVSVRRGALDWLQARLRAQRSVPMYVMDPPLHCGIFAGLRATVESELFSRLRFTDPAIPVVADQDGTVRTTAEGVRTTLLDGIVATVRWPLVVDTLRQRGIGTLYVAGPDRLFGRVRCTTSNFETIALDPRRAMQPRKRAPRVA